MPILRRRKGLGNAQGFFLIKKKGETSPKSGHFFLGQINYTEQIELCFNQLYNQCLIK